MLAITSITPNKGTELGGTSITIVGTDFEAAQGTGTVKVGGVDVTSYTSWGDLEIVCVVAAGAAGAKDVVITNNSAAEVTSTGGFTYLAEPTISSITPNEGTELGGTSITIVGTGFEAARGAGTVTIGGTAVASYISWSATQIVCITPAKTPGAKDVVVTTDSGLSETSTGGFTSLAEPTISNVTPAKGSVDGGASITITGTGFEAIKGTGGVTIGGTAASSITSWSDTEIVCVVPVKTAGAKDVVVTTDSGLSETAAGAFTYLANPTISTVSPAKGSVDGGREITITGTNFEAAKGTGGVTVGGAAVSSITSWAATQIVCVVPARTAGAKDVVVTTDAALVVTSTGGFIYLANPTISSVTPSTGTELGGTSITIAGTGFEAVKGTGGVKINNVSVASITSWSATQIVCVTPAGAIGARDVKVTTDAALEVTATGGFEYLAGTISNITPALGTDKGGTSITITGTGFGAVRDVGTVTVGGVAVASYASWSNTQIVCVTPAGTIGARNVVVTPAGGTAITSSGGFTFLADPDITGVNPSEIIDSGGESIVITGTDFEASKGAGTVKIYNTLTSTWITCTTTAWADLEITATTPLMEGVSGLTNIKVTNNSGLSSTLTGQITVIDKSSVIDATSETPNGTYNRIGQGINVKITFTNPVWLRNGHLLITMSTGDIITVKAIENQTIINEHFYLNAASAASADVEVSSISLTSGASLVNSAGVGAVLAIPTGKNISDTSAIVVTAPVPSYHLATQKSIIDGIPLGKIISMEEIFKQLIALVGTEMVTNGAELIPVNPIRKISCVVSGTVVIDTPYESGVSFYLDRSFPQDRRVIKVYSSVGGTTATGIGLGY